MDTNRAWQNLLFWQDLSQSAGFVSAPSNPCESSSTKLMWFLLHRHLRSSDHLPILGCCCMGPQACFLASMRCWWRVAGLISGGWRVCLHVLCSARRLIAFLCFGRRAAVFFFSPLYPRCGLLLFKVVFFFFSRRSAGLLVCICVSRLQTFRATRVWVCSFAQANWLASHLLYDNDECICWTQK